MTFPCITSFHVDVTPPVGHPLCGGWAPPAAGIADPLSANGLVLTGAQLPVVLLAVDWAEISNRTYHQWQQQIAAAVGTEPSRVAVHCTHSHSAPWPDAVVERLTRGRTGVRPTMDAAWCDEMCSRVAAAAREAMADLLPVTHIETGRGLVERVASNRRIIGEDGKSKAVRWTTTRDADVRAEPEGQIDPWLKTISFWNGDEKLAAVHYYAVHPSSYEDSWITPDFAGLARNRRAAEEKDVPHLYFTECAGDITAGKYNDGARELRGIFTTRLHRAMIESERNATRHELTDWRWASVPVQFTPREDCSPATLQRILENSERSSTERIRAALMLAFHERVETPIHIGALHLGDAACIVHLPGEAFIEYQHFAQSLRTDALVAVPSYGDCGPGYICLERSFDEGGYEPTDSFVSPCSENILREVIAMVLNPNEGKKDEGARNEKVPDYAQTR